ncbi:tetratricopeptide repeat protein [Sphingobium mellinum]|uniref:tetratricopeptide repeat protein n=1 Tax=Sphingobium mellinum TaxID=1387166 RepID=UPI0030EC07B6
MKRRMAAMALVVAITGCSSANKNVAIRPLNSGMVTTAQDMLARGDLLFARGDHALALDAYRRAMRQDPADPHALNGVAISYAAMGRHDLARQFFELALARAPQDERIYRNFARSLIAQGQKGEADALLAQLGGDVSGLPRMANRPTLAQLAAGSATVPTGAPSWPANGGLERLSMGEVRLRTIGGQPALPGRMLSQLTTSIVTVADGGATVPALSLTRELKAPIVTAAAAQPAAPAPAPAVALKGKAPAKPASAALAAEVDGCAGARAKDSGFRLPATGYSISLAGAKVDGLQKCASMAGGDEPDSLFEKLWKWSGKLG